MAESAVLCSCGFVCRSKAGFAKHRSMDPKKHKFAGEVPMSEAPPARKSCRRRKTGDMPVPKQARSQSKPPHQPTVGKYGGPRIAFCPSCGCPILSIERAWEVANSIKQ